MLLLLAAGWRAQATPWAGDLDLVAPHLERFGQQSLVFSRAYSCYPRTNPARAALSTGRYPHSTGVTNDRASLPAAEVIIDAVLKSAGYRTAVQPPREATEFIEKARDVPFYLRVPLDAAKVPRRYDPARLHPRANVPGAAEPAARKLLANYYDLCSTLDDQIGAVLAGLERSGVAGGTIVVFTSDHGTQLGSQGMEGDDVAFEESVRVPLAIRYPRASRPGASDALISQVDIMPTLLGLCRAPAPDGVQGHDLSSLVNQPDGKRPESVYAEGKMGQTEEWRMLVMGFDKIIVNVQTEVTHLYNLADDPYELANLAHEPAMQLKRDALVAQLRAMMRKLGDFKKRR